MLEFSRRLDERESSRSTKVDGSQLDTKLEELQRSEQEIQKASGIMNQLKARMVGIH